MGRAIAAIVVAMASVMVALPVEAQGTAKPAAGLTSAEMKDAEGLIKDYLAAKGWEEKQKIAEKLAAIDHPSKADVAKLANKAFLLAKVGARVSAKREQTCTNAEFPGGYLLNVPGSAKSGKPTGVFICLHGGGAGVGDAAQIEQLFGNPGQGMINVFPTVIQKDDSAWNTEREEQYVLAILDDLKRSYNIDTNRVFLAGHSMGGYGTWSIGPRHADLFAAISPMAGGIFVTGRDGGGVLGLESGIVLNLKNLPIWFYNSMDDPQVKPDSSVRAAEVLEDFKKQYGAYDFVWKRYTDIGHGTPKEGLGDIWKWMLAKKRDPLPKRVLWQPSRKYKRHFYWLRLEDSGSGQFDVQRDGNKFTVTGNASGLTILVNEKMIKFDQPVAVVDDQGKELYHDLVKYSLVATIETIDAKKDPELWFSGWVPLK